ncbi:MAG: hypothetical protein MZW92_76010 [Comamonadaceae bacterium]|nr:hypothetical protein [Comamonadaceae bacterium]
MLADRSRPEPRRRAGCQAGGAACAHRLPAAGCRPVRRVRAERTADLPARTASDRACAAGTRRDRRCPRRVRRRARRGAGGRRRCRRDRLAAERRGRIARRSRRARGTLRRARAVDLGADRARTVRRLRERAVGAVRRRRAAFAGTQCDRRLSPVRPSRPALDPGGAAAGPRIVRGQRAVAGERNPRRSGPARRAADRRRRLLQGPARPAACAGAARARRRPAAQPGGGGLGGRRGDGHAAGRLLRAHLRRHLAVDHAAGLHAVTGRRPRQPDAARARGVAGRASAARRTGLLLDRRPHGAGRDVARAALAGAAARRGGTAQRRPARRRRCAAARQHAAAGRALGPLGSGAAAGSTPGRGPARPHLGPHLPARGGVRGDDEVGRSGLGH